MQKLIVRNFGPIKELDLEIKDLMLFIGEQATGKSTVAKLVYFFRKVVKDELTTYLYQIKPISFDLNKENAWIQLRHQVVLAIGSQFQSLFFGTSGNQQFGTINFNYKPNRWISIQPTHQPSMPISIDFNDTGIRSKGANSWNELESLFKEIVKFREKYFSGDSGINELELKERRLKIEKEINHYFGEDFNDEIIFIPAGRSLLTVLSERLPEQGWDFLMGRFRDKILDLKPVFNKPLQILIDEKKFNGGIFIKKYILDLFIEKINEILKGEYRIEKDGEKIYFNQQESIKISQASSGQQEVVWILLQLFSLLINRKNVFLIIEEPEAHLFPQAQKSLVELITLLFNENNSQILITTHSPYILTAFNNLIYAGNVGHQHKEVNEVIPKMLWIDHEKVGAFRLGNGGAEDLMDTETHLMRVEEIDTVSQSINQDFDALLNLELQ